ncbi:MAG: hypothetical protein QXU82_00215 [Candidatus Aenigmatarchaeota archaeon]
MDMDKKVMALHLFAGLIMGYLSYVISNNMYSLVLMLAVAYVLKLSTNVLAREKKFSWWFGNGGSVYLFFWFISWIIFLNLLPA